MSEDQKPHFNVHPSVVYQLGESLISDAIQALIELIKNCYDADATYAKVTIDSQGKTEVPGSRYPLSGGLIIIEDDGQGMTLEDIKSGWLLISNRRKQNLKEAKMTTPGGRTPLGDKGLGRLGVQRLGQQLEIFTKSKVETGYHFGFSWRDFATAPSLQDVDIHLSEFDFPKVQGTKVVISDLKEPNYWQGQTSLKSLEQALSRMISPYRQIRDFTVFVEVDGKSLDLVEISDKVRDIAQIRYHLTFDGEKLTVLGKARLDYFYPQAREKVDQFAYFVGLDNGKAFYEFLQKQKQAQMIKLSPSQSEKWYVDFNFEKRLEDVDGVERDKTREDSIANPGPFWGEVDFFDLGSSTYQQQSVFDQLSEYRKYIKDLSGVRVYRDGFAIRVDKDWLGLGGQWTSAASYYVLKPDNTLGYIALSARHNMDLEETTDREGFKDTPYFKNFFKLLSEFVRFAGKSHGFFRRSSVEYLNEKNELLAQVNSRKTIENISRTIKKGLAGAPSYQKKLRDAQASLESQANQSRSAMIYLSKNKELTSENRDEVLQIFNTFESVLNQAKEAIELTTRYLEEINTLQNLGQVLEDRVDKLRWQMDEIYESVALGIVAEALSHEVFNVADQLAQRAKSIQVYLRNKDVPDRTLLTFVEYINSSTSALRKQMSYLSPALRYVREQKQRIEITSYLSETVEFYSSRLKKNNISMLVKKKSDKPFTIRMNRGKLTQIIDNFILNSEYWIKEDISQKRLMSGEIIFEIDSPFIRISDNGRGIDPSVEHALFEPFVSTKAKGQGRGLGLFIVKQLLDSEGCGSVILPERNKHQRLYKFQIDFRGAINE